MIEILKPTEWLYTKLYQNSFFFIDLWSLAHCWSGLILFIFLKSKRMKNVFLILFSLLFLYEIVEIIVVYFALGIFKPEIFKDQFTDIFIGMFGGVMAFFVLSLKRINSDFVKVYFIFITSVSYAFIWVGFYGYNYNYDFLNSTGINWFAWLSWTFGAFIIIYYFEFLKIQKLINKLVIIWLTYLVVLLLFETVGHVFLDINQLSYPKTSKPLIFSIINGTPLLHIMYVLHPFFVIILYLWIKKMLVKISK